MRKSVPAAVFVALFICASAAGAQTVEEIVARNIEAKGGYEVLKSTTSVRSVAKGTMQGRPVTAESLARRPFLVRSELTLEDPSGAAQKMVRAFDGQTAWMAFGNGPAQALPTGPQTDALKTTSQIDSPLLDYKAKGTTVTLGDPITAGGRKLHHLVVTPKDAPPMHYFIDASTYLESHMLINVDQGGQQVRMEMRFEDYRKVEGRTVPFTITQVMNGTPVMKLTFEKVEFDVPLDDALFKMPR